MLYGYNDYYIFSNQEVINEAIIRLFESGLIKYCCEAEVIFQQHDNLPFWNENGEDDLMDLRHLPPILSELEAHFRQFE